MIELYLQSQKILKFKVTIEGVDYSILSAHFRIQVDEIELGFIGEVNREQIIVTIPALRKLVNVELNKTYEAKLEVTGSGLYTVAWKGSVQFKPSISVRHLETKTTSFPRVMLKRRSS